MKSFQVGLAAPIKIKPIMSGEINATRKTGRGLLIARKTETFRFISKETFLVFYAAKLKKSTDFSAVPFSRENTFPRDLTANATGWCGVGRRESSSAFVILRSGNWSPLALKSIFSKTTQLQQQLRKQPSHNFTAKRFSDVGNPGSSEQATLRAQEGKKLRPLATSSLWLTSYRSFR